MESEKWQKIKEIFNAAVELSPAEGEAFLQNQNGTSREILAEVRALLAAEKENHFEKPLGNLSHLWQDEPPAEDFVGRKIGSYKITREIGRGGMGVVFEAVRETPDFSQTVALKVLKKGMDSDTMLRRFRQERQILASLEHPNIARLLDGGTTEEGLSFLAMEFVEGEPLDEYCEKKNLSVNERLRLFLQICAAVSFAHSRLVVHRDLKPTNIFVTANSTIKLLDFGIAKIISPDGDLSSQTVTALGMMTPAYASPEQIRGETVSTASDVYSLGLILYELLTGAPAYNFPNNRPDEIARIICESEPARPSSVISGLWSAVDKKTNPQSSPKTNPKSKIQNPKSLKGDLDNIILKALRKEPARRYASVEQFAGDISRHLEGLPVTARPDTFSYRFEKFVSRNRVSVVAGILVFCTLIGGIAATGWQAYRAEQQRVLAERRFNQVRELANNVVFKYHDEIKDLQGATKVREILVRDALKYLDSLQAESNNDMDLTRELAQAYMRVANVQGGTYQANLGDSKGALESYQKAIKLLEPLAENSADTKILAELRDAYVESGRVLFRVGEVDKQSEYLEKAIALSNKIVALDPANIEAKIYHARTLVHWADTLGSGIERKDNSARKMEIFRESLNLTEECLAREPENEKALRMLASVTHRLQFHLSVFAEEAKKAGNFDGEKSYWQEALIYAKRSTFALEKVLRTNPENPVFQRNAEGSKLNQGKIYRALGNTDEALRLPNEALKAQLAIAERDPKNYEIKLDLKESYEDLGLTYIKRGELEKAFANFRKSVAYNEEMLKNDPENLEFWIAKLRGQQVIADALLEKGENKTAAEIYQKAIVIADTETPKKFADFVEKFKVEVRESLSRCQS